MSNKTSKSMRADPLFMRNTYEVCGKWGIPLVKKQPLVSGKISLIAYSAICLGNPFPEMKGNLIVVDSRASRKAVR